MHSYSTRKKKLQIHNKKTIQTNTIIKKKKSPYSYRHIEKKLIVKNLNYPE